MRFQIQVSQNASAGLEKVLALGQRGLFANVHEADYCLKLSGERVLYVFGDVFYHLRADNSVRFIDGDSIKYLAEAFSEGRLAEATQRIEGQYICLSIDAAGQTAEICGDRYARVDSFYARNGEDLFFTTDLDFIFDRVRPEYDQLMLSHLFSVYGWYAPKGHTIYSNVKQLRVGEMMVISPSGVNFESARFSPVDSERYSDLKLEEYYQALKDSVFARIGKRGNVWISSSSGWDSSVLLGLAVEGLGAANTGMICGSMKYSAATEEINRFEMEKVEKIGRFFGIKPEIVDFDFKNRSARDYWEKALPFFRSRHVYTYVTYNFSKLSDGLSDAAGHRQTILNGETSDSFHNFGFSQFATLFHTKKSFTEYADKMNCYLYGPSFLKKVKEGTHNSDKVYQILKMMSGAEFDHGTGSAQSVMNGYLFPFFYGSTRIPFAKTYENPALRGSRLFEFPFGVYMPDAANSMTERNIYSWLIYMYHSFHSQGSTVSVQKHAMERNHHGWRTPYNDSRIIDILSKAPESWGRGLDLNNTKYPLKWVARNKIRFPYEILDEGPHSYLYDIIEGFSLFAEITYRSGVTDFFKQALTGKKYKDVLSDETFDLKYLDRLCEDYMNGKETKGQDFSNLVSLITLSVTGWY